MGLARVPGDVGGHGSQTTGSLCPALWFGLEPFPLPRWVTLGQAFRKQGGMLQDRAERACPGVARGHQTIGDPKNVEA